MTHGYISIHLLARNSIQPTQPRTDLGPRAELKLELNNIFGVLYYNIKILSIRLQNWAILFDSLNPPNGLTIDLDVHCEYLTYKMKH